MSNDANAEFLSWFKSSGGSLDESAVGLADFPDSGRGAIALRDVSEGERLFTIPRSILLSTRTATLPALLGEDDWKTLGDGWAGLILCMMWEEAKGAESKWAGYLASMPTAFSTLMFWTLEEIEFLKGSAVVDKIGRADAENEYSQKVLPLVQKRRDIFSPSHLSIHYTLEKYHIMGSRILSRSFTVSPWTGHDAEAPEDRENEGEGELSELMGEVNVTGDDQEQEMEVEEDGEEDEEKERVDDVSMVPMADMLNARYGCNSARLFYGKDDLQMVATKDIAKGAQIWNTYGDPPNSDLLRRYGYVDALELPDGLGTPADVVEINADLIVQASGVNGAERIEWWLEEGGDDVFVLDTTYAVPDDLLTLVRLLLLSSEEWTKARDKGKLPKPKQDERSYRVIQEVLIRRLSMYPMTMQDQQNILSSGPDLSEKRRNALIVTIAEQRILSKTRQRLEEERAASVPNERGKRKASGGEEKGRKKAKR